jgi:acylphosphatase
MNNSLLVHVKGRVQGVGFRYYTCREARRLGLNGWVRNEWDGSVLVHIQGNENQLHDMQTWLRKGPSSARVDELIVIPAAFDQKLIDFNID